LVAGFGGLARAQQAQVAMPLLVNAPAHYLLNCGGCHGIGGISRQNTVPDLRQQVGFFLCTEEGRRYALRLPNVAFANLSSAELTELMNYVMFKLGAQSVPKGARPYSLAEVEASRKEPFQGPSLQAYRADVVSKIVQTCPAASVLIDYGASLAKREVRNTP